MSSGIQGAGCRKNWLNVFVGVIGLLSIATVANGQQVVISQVYGAGGNSGATFQNDYVELFNRGTIGVNVNGWSLQYTSASGNSWGSSSTLKFNLPNTTIQPGQYYTIRLGSIAAIGAPVPADVDGSTTINMSATAGKIALVSSTTQLTQVTCPTDATIVDLVGYGTSANCVEGSANAPAPGATTAIFRVLGGCTDNNQNGTDFITSSPRPRTRDTYSPRNVCGGGLTTARTDTTSIGAIVDGVANFLFPEFGSGGGNQYLFVGDGNGFAGQLGYHPASNASGVVYLDSDPANLYVGLQLGNNLGANDIVVVLLDTAPGGFNPSDTSDPSRRAITRLLQSTLPTGFVPDTAVAFGPSGVFAYQLAANINFLSGNTTAGSGTSSSQFREIRIPYSNMAGVSPSSTVNFLVGLAAAGSAPAFLANESVPASGALNTPANPGTSGGVFSNHNSFTTIGFSPALTTSHTDSAAGGSSVDGVLGSNEYGPSNSYVYAGGGSGFGGTVGGATARLYMNSDATNLYVGFQPGAAVNDVVTVYFNTKAGGFTDATMDDTTTNDRKVISNLTLNPDDAFPFAADYALTIWNSGSGAFLYELQGLGNTHTFVSNANITPSGAGSSTVFREMSIPLTTLGVAGGGNVDFFVAYCATSNANSNESIPSYLVAFVSNAYPGTNGPTPGYGAFDRFVVENPCTPPSIASGPTPPSQTKCEGESASIAITASGTGPLSYQWRKGTTPLSNGGNISGADTATLTINPVAPGDTATDYNCVVTGQCAPTATSSNATLTVFGNEPTACFSANPNPAACNQTVNFNGSCSSHSCPARTIVSYEWDFDGDLVYDATGQTTTHSYPAFGTYTVTLRVTDDNVPPKTDTQTVNVVVDQGNQPPTAEANGPYTVCTGGSVTLSGAGSSDPDGACDSIVSYEWDLNGDSNFSDATGSNPTVTWATLNGLGLGVGPHTITLRVKDTLNVTATDTATLTIYTNTPTACFTANPNPAGCNQTINFDGSCSSHSCPSRSIVSYDWDFGDSNTGSGVTTTHSYSAFGTYTAKLTVTDDNVPAQTHFTTITINVNQGNNPPVANAGGPYTVCTGSDLHLNGSGSSDPDSGCGDSIVTYAWDVDNDGQFDDAFGATPTVTWATLSGLGIGPGLHTVKLEVLDSFSVPDEDSTTLTVTIAPSIGSGPTPASQTKCAGDSASISIMASGSGPLLYQWYYGASPLVNGGRFSGVDSDTLTINPLIVGDTGLYHCEVSGACSPPATSGDATLTVNTTPVVTLDPIDATVGIGANVQFMVAATGGGLSYQWYHGVNPLSNGGTISGADSDTLTITGVVPGDAGNYSCVVSNNCGSDTSAPALLTVNNEATLTLTVPPGCHTGSKLVVAISMTGATTTVVGGQYFLAYNPSVLQLVSASPGDPPFTRQVYECSTVEPPPMDCVPTAGIIDYATGIVDGGMGTSDNRAMAYFSFNVLQDVCTLTPNLVWWRASGPNGAINQLSDPNGDPVTANTVNLGPVKIDTTPPEITCPADTTVACTATTQPSNTGTATATDNCGGVAVTFSDSVTAGSCAGNYSIARTWTATDDCGNTDVCVQTITVTDTTGPTITCPGDTTVDCDGDTSPTGTGTATATDDCSGVASITHSDSTAPGSCAGNYVITRTWTATDGCGNSSSCDQIITVTDTNGPVVTCPSDTTANCTTTQPANTGMATAVDDCSGATVSFSDVITPGSCAGNYTIARTWSAVDGCGNASNTCVQTITVTDTTGPVVTCPANTSVNCTATTQPAGTGTATATDDCSGVASISHSDVITPGSCAGNYTIARTWSAVDNCGNASNTCVQTITVTDTTGPVVTCPSDTTTNCTTTQPANTGTATAVDDCSGATVSFSDVITPGSCAGNYTIARTWSAVDGCGNPSNTCVQTITVTDTTGPVVTCPANTSVNCTATTQPAGTGTATATDDCSGVASISHSDVILPGSCAGNYTIARTWSAVDNCGNPSNTCVQTITVTDTTGPSITCPADASVDCAATTQPAGTGTATATDDCSGVASITHSDSVAAGSCAGNYVITRTWTATDGCGNSSSCDQIITVTDTTGPTITSCPGPNIQVHAAAGGCLSAGVTYSGTATDDCSGVASIIFSPPSGTQFPVGTTTVTMTATDGCGNPTQCQFTVTNDGMNEVAVDVELGGGVMDTGSYDRCITFELWNGATMTYSTSQMYTFTNGNIAPQTLLVPCANGPYSCITARDRLHTLRRTINPIPSPGGVYTANFTGAKKLIGGNFNDDKFIDILDFGVYTIQDLTGVGPNTSCSIVPPTRHADANGDGIVDSIDFGFVANNFLQVRDPNCDGSTTTVVAGDGSNGGPVTRIAVSDLAKIGMGDIAPADLTGDGWIDQADITAWQNGVRPQKPAEPKPPSQRPIGSRPGGGFQTTGGSISDAGAVTPGK